MSADKIIITEDGEEINLTTLEREFLGCFEEAEEGEEYVSEYSAPGYDENGNPVEIFMMFTEIKGEEVDPENLNWSQDADRVEVR